jgi:hypothetical protein
VGLRLWVHGRQFPDAEDYWDSNWLLITARVEASGARVEIEGPLIRNTEIAAFAAELRQLSATLRGTARLDCLEPELRVTLSAADAIGHIAVEISITPDQLSQSHRFEFGCDQSYLPGLIASCEAMLEKYPVLDERRPRLHQP